MTMQRRHFELIAEVVRESLAHRELGPCEAETLAQRFCATLRATNPNFNEARFLRACGVEG